MTKWLILHCKADNYQIQTQHIPIRTIRHTVGEKTFFFFFYACNLQIDDFTCISHNFRSAKEKLF